MDLKNLIISLILLDLLSLPLSVSASSVTSESSTRSYSSGTSETRMTLIVPPQVLLTLDAQKEQASEQGVLVPNLELIRLKWFKLVVGRRSQERERGNEF